MRARSTGSILLAAVLALSGLTALSQPAAADWPTAAFTHPQTVSADALPTVQINGVVWAQQIVGNTVYVGGQFTAARNPGVPANGASTPRSNFLAYDLTTGALRTDINLPANAQVRTIRKSSDGSRIYVGGDFTSFGNATRSRIAAVNTATNTLVGNFTPSVGYHVHDIAVTATTVYVAGNFQNVGAQTRLRLAAFTPTGDLLAWAPEVPDREVQAIAVSPDGTQVAVGGNFETLNGSTTFGRGLGVVSAATGATMPFAVTSIVRNGGPDGAIMSLETDGGVLYGSGYTFGRDAGTLEGVFAADWGAGTVRWVSDCHGDTHTIFPHGDVVYGVGHAHYCGNIDGHGQPTTDSTTWNFRRGIALSKQVAGTVMRERLGYTNFAGQPRPDLLNFFPSLNAGTFTGLNQGPWHVTGDDRYLLMGGEFTTVNGVAQQGLVRFQRRDFATNARGPQNFAANYPITVRSLSAGAATIGWQTNDDQDDATLEYRVYRRTGGTGNGTLMHTRSVIAPWWNLKVQNWTDTSATPGATYEYRVQVTDGHNNFANSPWTSINIASFGSAGSYLTSVLASQPDSYWRLDDAGGSSTAVDLLGTRNASVSSGITFNQTGALAGDADRAAQFSGGLDTFAVSPTFEQPTHTLSLETWFRAARNANGGQIIGFNNSATSFGSLTTQDRTIYMDANGRVHFGVNPVNATDVSSATNYRDNVWHHVVGTLGTDGLRLYVDGQLRGSRTDITYARTGYYGYWRIGGGAINGFANAGTTANARFFDGSLDEVAMYKRALSPAEVTAHFAAGSSGTPQNQPPNAAIQVTSQQALNVSVSGLGSSDPDGTIGAYRWTFGDGTPAESTPTASHTYATAGTYTITLVVTDNDLAQSQTTTQVVVAPAQNQPPNAAIQVTSQQALNVSVSGLGSSDPDGTIGAYRWTFGDGTPAESTPTASHTYGTSGTYTITLVVTDNDLAQSQTTTQVNVTDGTVIPAVAADAFERTVTGGLGTADVGGPWSLGSPATGYAVSGGAGRIVGAVAGTRAAYLTGATSTDVDVAVDLAIDRPATGGGAYVWVAGRRVSNGNDYRAKVRYLADGSVQLFLVRTLGGTETILASTTVPGLVASPNTPIRVRFRLSGTTTATLNAKVWPSAGTEPLAWQLSATEATPAVLQSAGHLGILLYTSGSWTGTVPTLLIDNLSAIPPQ